MGLHGDTRRWDDLRRRVEKEVSNRLCRSVDGVAFVSVVLVTDSDGVPVGWFEPSCKVLEPKNIDWHEILSSLS